MSIHDLADPTLELPEPGIVGKVTDDGLTENTHQATEYRQPFSDEEVEQYKVDNLLAGRTIGKILAILFTYTVIIMSVVLWWTLMIVRNQ